MTSKTASKTKAKANHQLTTRNLIYSILALALISSYIYVQTQQQPPVVASDQQHKQSDQSANNIPVPKQKERQNGARITDRASAK